jgi:hypothetical protein
VNDLLETGASYAMVLRTLDDINSRLEQPDWVTIDSIRNQSTRHFPVQQMARATYREILERRVKENSVDFVEGVATAITPLALLKPSAADHLFRDGKLLAWGLPATGVLVETLLDRGADGDVAEAGAAIDRLAAAPADEGLMAREVWLLRLQALLARAQRDDTAYCDFRDRYRARAKSLGFEGHMKWAEAMPWQRLGSAFTTASTLLGVTRLGFSGQLVEVDLTAALW